MMITGLLPPAMLVITVGCAQPGGRPAVGRTSGPVSVTVAMATPRPASTAPPASVDPRTPTRAQADFTLPMRVATNSGGTLVFVPVRVNGKGPYEFVLDTGSSNSSVDRSLVGRLSLPHTGQRHRVQGVTGSGTVPIVKIRRWTLGGVPLRSRSLAVVDLGMGVAGLLGSDELRHFGSVTLDFAHDRVSFHRE